MTRPLLGMHVSAAGGLHQAILRGTEMGAEVIQIFGASPRAWSAPMPNAGAIEAYKQAFVESPIEQVFLHAAYLVNLGAADEMLRARSVKNLAAHLAICEAIGADGLIFHPGSGGEQLREEAMDHLASGMRQVLAASPGTAELIMENTAGGGNKIGDEPEELGELMRRVGDPRVKVCIDTAHAFEAGLIERYEPEEVTAFADRWDAAVELGNVVAIHANDSKTPYKSRHDQHENIGKGHIGLEGFRNLAKETRFHEAAWMLEVPGMEGLGPDKENLEILRGCFA